MTLDLRTVKNRILNDIKNIEESKMKQEFYLKDFFENINGTINELKNNYQESIKQSFTSLRTIFLNKVEK